uniref:Membrane protein, palmitoylated 4b (MAGUK p55 subfamily member 4) n=1 Tax=Mastacembelus armatus TaxID=205130 RepID=A0A7N8XVH5_9TELE
MISHSGLQAQHASVQAADSQHHTVVLSHPLPQQLLQCPKRPLRGGGALPTPPTGHAPDDWMKSSLLSGPSGVGVNELRRRLIEMNPNIFQGPVPHTTRTPKAYEESGREYFFTSVLTSRPMSAGTIDYGEHKGNLYGTSIESVNDVLNSGKICVIDIEPNAVRTHELRPYIIYVKPPPLERLRETRQDSYIITNYYVNRPFKIESHNWQFFDHVIVNDELQDSCVQLLTAVRKAQDEPQWVPASWIRPTAES